MLIDCGQCEMQHTTACDDCVVSFLFVGTPVEMSDTEARAVSNLAEVGLLPPLRLVPKDRQAS